jgi:hypothetical protein
MLKESEKKKWKNYQSMIIKPLETTLVINFIKALMKVMQ